jgi:hypothetical protein
MRHTKKRLNNKNKTKKHKSSGKYKTGGSIQKNNIFNLIKSIGFEIETTELIKFTLTKETDQYVLVNSALTNIDLEYGFSDPNEYTDIKDEKDETFKITNDAAEDSDFNDLINTIYKKDTDADEINNPEDEEGQEDEDENYDEEEEEEVEPVIKLQIPKNQYLSQLNYDVKFREISDELTNFSSFTDTEFISTYYNPVKSNNVIQDYFFKSIKELIEHLNKLITINNSKMMVKTQDENYNYVNDLCDQSYILPNTTLLYYNSSLYSEPNYNIQDDLRVVVQMTFSCDIMNIHKLMIQLLYLNANLIKNTNIANYINANKNNKNVAQLTKLMNDYKDNLNYDVHCMQLSFDIATKLFKHYEKVNNPYQFGTDLLSKKLRMYVFLIIYKLVIYLNSFIELGSMLKKHLSFAVRHNNHALFLEIKKIIRMLFSSSFNGKDDTFINNEIVTIFNTLFDEKVLRQIYDTNYIKNKKKRLELSVKNDNSLKEKNYGNPLYSVVSYIDYLNNKDSDWLVDNNIDEKSTKFDLENDTIIVEFRDFPTYSYMELFLTGNDIIRDELIKNNVGTLSIKTIKKYMTLYNI